MDSDAGRSLARRHHRPFSPFLYLSSPFVYFIDFLQVCLLFLGFLRSSFVHGCASSRYCHIQTRWLLFLTCSPAPSVTAALVPDLTFEGCFCTALSRSPKTAVLSDLFFSSSSWAMNFLPMGKTCSNLSCCERSFCVGVFRCSFARSTSLGCSELYSASSEVNRLLSEDPKTNHLSTPLPFTVAKPGACSPFHSKTDSGDKRLNFGFIDTLWLRYGNIGVQSLLLATASAIPPNLVKRFYCYAGVKVARASSSNSLALHRQLFSEALYPSALVHMSRAYQPKLASLSSSQCSVSSSNLRLLKLQSSSPINLSFVGKFIKTSSRQGQERSSSPSSFSQERIFPPQSLLLRGDLLPVLKIRKIYLYPSHLLSYVKVRLGPVDATILIGLRVEVWDRVAMSHVTVTNRSLFAEFEVRYQSLIDRIASGNFDILRNALSNFHKFVSLSLFNVGLYAWELACWLAHRVLYDDAFNLVIT
ncbi:unnamed protein product [Brassica napus]|uniref:(rape) hypothetical protein n=1 Tax=Brassica napus TaxID=3708 RepID=A0A816KDT5_BRANA|nr:unnamed protein product [Brassica napus]